MAAGRGVGWIAPLLAGELRHRDARLRERMDAADADPELLANTYRQFAVVNALVSGWADVYRRHVRPLLSTTVTTTVLDVGSGGGDLTRLLARWAARDGLRMRATGIDPDERAAAFAASLPPMRGVDFRRTSTRELAERGERFDLVVSNHVLHHLTGGELGALLADSERIGRRSVHADITRSGWAYLGFGLMTWPLFPRSFIRDDGLASIRRSHTPAELGPALPPGWLAQAQSPTRYVLTRSARSGA